VPFALMYCVSRAWLFHRMRDAAVKPCPRTAMVNGAPQPRYAHDGRWYVEAHQGREYGIRLRNPYAVRVAVALSVGLAMARRRLRAPETRFQLAFSPTVLYAAYGASVLVTGVVQELAWQYPSITQAILALNFSHLALVFLLARRFTRPVFSWEKLAALMALEVALGFTGYFANFREPLLMGSIALIEVFDRRDSRHWAFFSAVLAVLGVSSIIWMNVRGELRRDVDEEIETTRIERLDKATRRFAELMMDSAVTGALGGKTMEAAGESIGEGPTAPHPFAKAQIDTSPAAEAEATIMALGSTISGAATACANHAWNCSSQVGAQSASVRGAHPSRA